MSCVAESIVPSNLCIGCGVCVSICPHHLLCMQSNKYGEYEPFLNQYCQKDCGICYKVCPFGKENPDETQIGRKWFGNVKDVKYDNLTGHYLVPYIGHVSSEQLRLKSASGGLATWLLSTLLKEGKINAAICVTPSKEPDTLFKYSIMTNRKEIEASSGSAYYPVELSEVMSYIMDNPGRYAITALPCFAKAIRLAQMKNKVLNERIVFIIGITCGQMKSKHYTEYLARLSEVEGELSRVYYRGKEMGCPANNYYFQCESKNGKKGKVFWNDGMSDAWLSRWFTLNACNFCDDVFAECADVVCMDAWLPEYVSDWKGTSLVLIRNPLLLNTVQDGVEKGEIALASLPIDKVKQSQNGLINFKRQELRTRLWLAEKDGEKIPKKRVIAKRNLNQIDTMKARLLKDTQIVSKERYLEWKDGNVTDIPSFQEGMEQYLIKLRTLQRAAAISHIPLAAIRKLRGNKL